MRELCECLENVFGSHQAVIGGIPVLKCIHHNVMGPFVPLTVNIMILEVL
jgi:hypothetical protein